MQNFNQLFPQNINLSSPKTIRLLQGELTLFKRPKSHQWQCRFKLPNGQWHAASTATEDETWGHYCGCVTKNKISWSNHYLDLYEIEDPLTGKKFNALKDQIRIMNMKSMD